MEAALGFIRSPVGPMTIHFWGPMANWGLVVAGILDMNKPLDRVSEKMTGVLAFYSCLFMRFAWRVAPRNYMLLACHMANFTAQSNLLIKKLNWMKEQKAAKEQPIVSTNNAVQVEQH